MGRQKAEPEIKWTEGLIQEKLSKYLLSNSTKRYEIFGRFVYDWESDYLAITKAGYAYECEIKISRADFKNDSKKEQKHLILEDMNNDSPKPNYFYYAVPEGLITPEEVPDNYGLIYVHEYRLSFIKDAPMLHRNKVDVERLCLTDKFYWGMTNYRDKYVSNAELREEIKSLNKSLLAYDELLSNANCRITELEGIVKNALETNDITILEKAIKTQE